MRKHIFIFSVWITLLSGAALGQDLDWEQLVSGNLDFRVVMVNPKDNRIIFAGQPGSLLKSVNGGKDWRRVLSIRGRLRDIHEVKASRGNYNLLFAATDSGLYRSDDAGEHWVRIFRGKKEQENYCETIAVCDQLILAGTKAGLFISRDNGRSWYKQGEGLAGKEILNIDCGPDADKVIYLAAQNGVFKSIDSAQSWENVYPAVASDNEDEALADSQEGELAKRTEIRFVKADRININLVYLATGKGVYQSQDQGKNWHKLTEYGLLNSDVKMLAQADNLGIIALNCSGVFIFQNERWQECSINLSGGKFNYITLDHSDNIYIAAEKSIWRASFLKVLNYSGSSFVEEYLKSEPDIRKVQDAAIKYAELAPGKISRWRKDAARRAWLPQVSVGLDRNSTDLWHWEGGSTTKSDDDVLRRGKDTLDWDVSLSWDLGDLFWNEAQTAIDVRSKLMVELRDDILDQVNKLYFERLRVRDELDNLAIEDRGKRFQKQLRLRELAASLDALTCGYYSEQLRLLAGN